MTRVDDTSWGIPARRGGDGKRVKGTVGPTTTAYVGDYYERDATSSIAKQYYSIGGVRVAMKENSTLRYLLSDHLGSTALKVSEALVKQGEVRYYAFGGDRYTSGDMGTTYRYTGQRAEQGIGLYFYNARWYDASLGRFTQADTIVPQPGNPQSLNRYSYTLNNPLRYTDPTGQFTVEELLAFGIPPEVIAEWQNSSAYANWWQIVASATLWDQVTASLGAQSILGGFALTLGAAGDWNLAILSANGQTMSLQQFARNTSNQRLRFRSLVNPAHPRSGIPRSLFPQLPKPVPRMGSTGPQLRSWNPTPTPLAQPQLGFNASNVDWSSVTLDCVNFVCSAGTVAAIAAGAAPVAYLGGACMGVVGGMQTSRLIFRTP